MLWQPARKSLNRAEREGNAVAPPPTPQPKPQRLVVSTKKPQHALCERKVEPKIRKKSGPKPKPEKADRPGRLRAAREAAAAERLAAAAAAFAPVLERERRQAEVLDRVRAIELEDERAWLAVQPPENPRIRPSAALPGLHVCACRDHCGVGVTPAEAWKDWHARSGAGDSKRVPHAIRSQPRGNVATQFKKEPT